MASLYELKKNYTPMEITKLDESDLQWFRDSKFGMFIHFGLYSLLGRGEWVMFNERINSGEYSRLADQFSIEEFDAEKWARIAKKAGMKYMVLTTRHHDGFSLFDSRVSAFNSMNSAAKRDIVAEYVEACRSEGLKVGLYYSPMDWRFPGYFFPEMYLDSALDMRDQCKEQLRELMTNYGKIDLLWFDGEWLAHGGIKHGEQGWYRDPKFGNDEIYFKVNYFWESEKVLSTIRELQPEIILNNRFGLEGDFHVREGSIGEIRTDKPWESCGCLTGTWGWMPDRDMISLRECIQKLVSIAVKDGNFLLNLSPTGAGRIEQRQEERLFQIGNWLDKYSESIYGTRGGPFLPGTWGGSTYKENKVYVHVTDWVEDKIVLPFFSNRLLSYSSLTSQNVELTQTDEAIEIHVAVEDRDTFDTIIVLEFEYPIVWDGIEGIEKDIYGLADGLQH